MESELAACPVCTAVVTLTRPDGRFVICTTCDQAWNADTFNTLARRAEIGRLVEQLTDACRVVPMIGKGEDLLTELRALAAELEVSDDD